MKYSFDDVTEVDLKYKSPVTVFSQGLRTAFEDGIFQAIQSYGVCVDKDELVKALQYDRGQYEKGFIDGSRCEIDTIKAEVAREIFSEIEKWLPIIDYPIIADLKKKYTEELK